jgi:F-type H+-transporting ATPase subunit delta
MSGIALAGRYAKALFELAEKKKLLDKVEGDLEQLMKVVGESQELAGVLGNPVVSKNNVAAVVCAVLNKLGANEITVDFLNILAQNGRIKYLSEIVESYSNLMMKNRGEEYAYITTAKKLKSDKVAIIEGTLGKALGSKIKVVTAVNDNILGGMIVRIGSKMLDASVVGQLDKLAMLNKKAIAALN